MSPAEIRNATCGGEDCVICAVPRDQPCAGTTGVHLARVACAARDHLISQGDFASVIHDADVFTGTQIVLAGAR